MEFNGESFIPFINISQQNDDNNQLMNRNLSALASLAGLSSLQSTIQSTLQQNHTYSIESFKLEKNVDPSTVSIREFTDNFKANKLKLANIEIAIEDLEKQKNIIKENYESTMKHLVEFFNIPEKNIILDILREKAYIMVNLLELDKYYEEKNKLLEYYKTAIPLLNQVKQEFFADQQSLENCHICFDKQICWALNCGHTLCDDCKKKLVNNCYLCRSPILKITKIFF